MLLIASEKKRNKSANELDVRGVAASFGIGFKKMLVMRVS
jgi:hypothetical protein